MIKYSKNQSSRIQWGLLFSMSFISLSAQSEYRIQIQYRSTPCANCSFDLKADSLVLVQGVTNEKGYYSLKEKDQSKIRQLVLYLGDVKCRLFIGKNILTDGYVLNCKNALENMNAQKIKEVVLLAKKPLISDEGNRLIYNVVKDSAAQTVATTTELLRRVPMVFIGAGGQPTIQGSTNVRIKLNGRIINGIDTQGVLNQINPSDIKEIEVITNPSVKDGSEGGSILNIITKRKLSFKQSGYANAGVGNRGNHLVLSYRRKFSPHWDFSSSFSGMDYNTRTEKEVTSHLTQTQESGNSRGLLLNGQSIFRHTRKKSTYEWMLSDFVQSSKDRSDYDLFTGNTISQTGSYRNYNRYHYLTGDFSYKYKGKYTDVQWQIGLNYLPVKNRYQIQAATNHVNTAYIYSPYFQLDYSRKITRWYTLEAGIRANWDHIKGRTFSGLSFERTDFKARRRRYTIYGNHRFKWNHFKVEAGLGFKHYRFVYNQKPFNRNYWYPSVNGSYKISSRKTISTSYSRRVTAPSFQQLLPLESLAAPNIFQLGSPQVQPVVSDKFEIGYSYKAAGLFVKISSFYQYTRNNINSVFESQHDHSSPFLTYKNIGKSNTYGISSWWNLSFFKNRLSINYGPDILYRNIGSNKIKNNGFQMLNKLYISLKLIPTFRVQFFGNFNTPVILLQGKQNNYTFSNFSLQKSFLKEKIWVAVSLDNPFSKEFLQKTTFTDYQSQIAYKNRGIRLFFTYTFGKKDNQNLEQIEFNTLEKNFRYEK